MRNRKKKGDVEKEYFDIINYIRTNFKLPSYCTNNYYFISNLKKKGIIERKGYGVWEVNDDKVSQMEFQHKVIKKSNSILPVTEQNIRGHGFSFNIKLPNYITLSRLKKILELKKVEYNLIGPKLKTPQFIFKGYRVWFTRTKLIIYFPKDKSYFSDNAYSSQKYATYDVINLISLLERHLNLNLKLNNKYSLNVSRQHYSKVNDELARIANTEKAKISLFGMDGKQWLLVDNSLNLNELETVHSIKSADDMENVIKPFYNDLRNHYQTTGETITISKLKEVVYDLNKTLSLLSQKQNNINELQEKTSTQILEMATGLTAVSKSLQILTNPKPEIEYDSLKTEKPNYIG
jgi:hypothetical protein